MTKASSLESRRCQVDTHIHIWCIRKRDRDVIVKTQTIRRDNIIRQSRPDCQQRRPRLKNKCRRRRATQFFTYPPPFLIALAIGTVGRFLGRIIEHQTLHTSIQGRREKHGPPARHFFLSVSFAKFKLCTSSSPGFCSIYCIRHTLLISFCHN